jgi:predicted CDP-diglyceride synthetase/phosphatidate cytidylyltransferase
MTVQPQPNPPPQLGPNKTIAAVVGGAIVTLVVYGLSFAHITPPPEVTGALQTLIVAGLVYYTPHGK